MTTVTLSSKFQIVIPKEIRETVGFDPGFKLEIIPYEDRVELIRLKPLRQLKGSLRGIDTIIKREKDRL